MSPEQKIKTEHKLLGDLVKLGRMFRDTPIVDNDFCVMRDNFDFCLRSAEDYLKNNEAVKTHT